MLAGFLHFHVEATKNENKKKVGNGRDITVREEKGGSGGQSSVSGTGNPRSTV